MLLPGPSSSGVPDIPAPVDILLVDDHPANLLSLEAILADLGQNLIKASSGEEALRRVLTTDFAVILLDVQMEDLDGFETAKLIRGRERSRQTPIIFLTAYESNRLSTEEAYALGAVDYLLKPLVPVILKAKVAGFIELFRKTEQVKQQAEQLRQMERQEFTQKLADENARLRQAEEKLKDEARRKDEFLAMLAHELRNPLAPVRNALQIMKITGIDADAAEQARQIMERQISHMVRLVDDLLDVSRIMRNRIELRKDRLDIATVFARAVETAQEAMDAQGHELSVSLPAPPILIEGDQVRLAQVLSNLLLNAAKFTNKGGRVSLSAEREAPSDDFAETGSVLIRVRDSGIGIDEHLLPDIFDIFVQSNRTLARSQGGLGIGLTVVKRIVEMHGGKVTAMSMVGQGTEFAIRLPALPVHQSTVPRGAEVPLAAAAHPRRVLIVDDNVDIAKSTAMFLRLLGHSVATAYNGTDALRLASDFQPQVAFLDIGLPDMTGYDLARQLRARPENGDLVIIGITGYGREEDRQLSEQAGFDRHLIKPVDPPLLAELLVEFGGSQTSLT